MELLHNVIINVFKGCGNTLFNGFSSDVSKIYKEYQVGIQLKHFNPINQWSLRNHAIVDKSTANKYCNDSQMTVRKKCAALFAASFILQPIGLTLNLLNRIGKVVTFAHFWSSSQEKRSFTARLAEWEEDLLRIVSTPLILLGMLSASLYGATLSPYDGRKLYGTFERLAYSGGYQSFSNDEICLNNYFLAPCFQPFEQPSS